MQILDLLRIMKDSETCRDGRWSCCENQYGIYGILYPYCPVVGMMCWLVMVMISDSLSHDAVRYWGVGDKYGIVWDSMSRTTEIEL